MCMRVRLLVAAALLVALVAGPADARHNWARLDLAEFALADPLTPHLRFHGTVTFSPDGYHCWGDNLGGRGVLERAGREPVEAWIDGCSTAVTTTNLFWLRLYVWPEDAVFEYQLAGPNHALAGYPYGGEGERGANATFHWGPADYLGVHEGDPIPDWVPYRPTG